MASEVVGGRVRGLMGQHLACGVCANSRLLVPELLGVENPHIC